VAPHVQQSNSKSKHGGVCATRFWRNRFLQAAAHMGVGTGGAKGAAAPPTFGTGEQAIALAPPKV